MSSETTKASSANWDGKYPTSVWVHWNSETRLSNSYRLTTFLAFQTIQSSVETDKNEELTYPIVKK